MEGPLFIELRKLLRAVLGVRYVDLYAGQFEENSDGDEMPGKLPAVLVGFGKHKYTDTGRRVQRGDVLISIYTITHRTKTISQEISDAKVLTEINSHTDMVDKVFAALQNYRGAVGDINHSGIIRVDGMRLLVRGQYYISVEDYKVNKADTSAMKNKKIAVTGFGVNVVVGVPTGQ